MAQPQVTDMRALLEATRGRLTDSSAAIAEQPLTGALKVTEPTPATGDFPAAHGLGAIAAAVAVSRADSLRTEASAVRMVADTPAVDMPAVDTAAVEVTVAADTAAGAKLV
jgi:hypothetical protein